MTITGGAGYKTLLLAVYKTSLFFEGSEVAGYKTSHFFRSSQVAVYKTLLFSEGPNLQKVFFQIWLTIRPLFIFARYLMRGLEGSYGQVSGSTFCRRLNRPSDLATLSKFSR